VASLRSHGEFLELLPFFVNGTLAPESRAAVEEYVAEHPKAKAELALQQAIRSSVREEAPEVPVSLGFDRTMARVDEGLAPARPATSRAAIGQRVREWARWFRITPALATACTVVAVQAVVILMMAVGREEPFESVRGGAVSADNVVVQVLFRPEAAERDLRAALQRSGGRLIDGPTDLGFYFVAVPTDQGRAALATLRAEAAVQDAQIVAGRRR
jgi:anti-sigma factor RsiW